MIRKVIDGVIDNLSSSFPNTTIYDEEVTQSLQAPAFIVRCVSSTDEMLRGKLRDDTHFVEVVYYPEEPGRNELYDVMYELFQVLEMIYIEDTPTWGTDIDYEIVDGCLVVTVNYNFHVIRVEEPDPVMERMEYGNE